MKIQKVIEKLEAYRNENPSPMSFPKDCEDEFLKIFHEEIHRQRIETKPCTSIKKIDDFTRFISYKTAKYISDFNTIMYNQLLK